VFFFFPKTGGGTLEQVDWLFSQAEFVNGVKKAEQAEE